jgi:hypothetical protein
MEVLAALSALGGIIASMVLAIRFENRLHR